MAENVRVKQMVEAMPINVMTADLKDFRIDYANKATLDTVRQLEHVMPVKADELIGTCIDIFHIRATSAACCPIPRTCRTRR